MILVENSVSFDAEFNSEFNSTTFRPNSDSIANPDAEYFSKKFEKSVFWGEVPFFDGKPGLKIIPFDSESNSTPNSI